MKKSEDETGQTHTDEIFNIFKRHPNEAISVEYISKRTEINKNTIYGTLSKLKKRNKIKNVKPGVHILNIDEIINAEVAENVLQAEEKMKQNKDFLSLIRSVNDYAYHRTYDLFSYLPGRLSDLTPGERDSIRQLFLDSIKYGIRIQVDEEIKEILLDQMEIIENP